MPDTIETLSPGELEAMQVAAAKRAEDEFDRMVNAVSVGVSKLFKDK